MVDHIDFIKKDYTISHVVDADGSSMSSRYLSDAKKIAFEHIFDGVIRTLKERGVHITQNGFYSVTLDMLPVTWQKESDKEDYSWGESNEIRKTIILAVEHGCKEFRFYP